MAYVSKSVINVQIITEWIIFLSVFGSGRQIQIHMPLQTLSITSHIWCGSWMEQVRLPAGIWIECANQRIWSEPLLGSMAIKMHCFRPAFYRKRPISSPKCRFVLVFTLKLTKTFEVKRSLRPQFEDKMSQVYNILCWGPNRLPHYNTQILLYYYCVSPGDNWDKMTWAHRAKWYSIHGMHPMEYLVYCAHYH